MAKVGDNIRLVRMVVVNGTDYQASMMNGKEGVIELIDDNGQLHGTWGGLAVIPGLDVYEVIENA